MRREVILGLLVVSIKYSRQILISWLSLILREVGRSIELDSIHKSFSLLAGRKSVKGVAD